MRTASGVVLAFLMAACSNSAPPQALPSDEGFAEAQARLAAPREVTTRQAMLSATPGRVGACPGAGRIQSKLAWKTQVASVKLEVTSGPNEPRRLFAAGAGVGAAETGDWVVEGTHFYLVDAASGGQLAMLRIDAVNCGR